MEAWTWLRFGMRNYITDLSMVLPRGFKQGTWVGEDQRGTACCRRSHAAPRSGAAQTRGLQVQFPSSPRAGLAADRAYFGCGTMRRYGFGAFQPWGYFC